LHRVERALLSALPAGTNTNIAAGVQFPPDLDIDVATRLAGLRGIAEPEEVAVFAFLASDEAARSPARSARSTTG
jgi:hypothetical protein